MILWSWILRNIFKNLQGTWLIHHCNHIKYDLKMRAEIVLTGLTGTQILARITLAFYFRKLGIKLNKHLKQAYSVWRKKGYDRLWFSYKPKVPHIFGFGFQPKYLNWSYPTVSKWAIHIVTSRDTIKSEQRSKRPWNENKLSINKICAKRGIKFVIFSLTFLSSHYVSFYPSIISHLPVWC